MTYSKIVGLNTQIAKIMYDESVSVVELAIIYDIIVSAASAGAAIIAAILLSKKLTPSLTEIERRAKREIEKFVKTSSGMLTQTELNSSRTNNGHNSFNRQLEIEDSQGQGPLMLLNTDAYQGREEKLSQSSQILDSFLSATTTDKNSLVVMTRKGSNLYYKVRRKAGAVIYILSASAQSPLHTSEEGLLVISLWYERIKTSISCNNNSQVSKLYDAGFVPQQHDLIR